MVALSEKDQAREKTKDYRREVRKEVKDLLGLLEAAEKAPAGEVLYGGKAALGREALLALPRLLKIYLQLMVDASDYLTGLPEEEWKSLEDAALASLEEMPLGEAVNAYFRLSRRLWEEDAEALAEAELGLAAAAIERIDFGKVRKAVEVKLEGRYPVYAGVIDRLVGDPIIIANLLTAAPAYANTLLRLLNRVLAGLDLPSEILASAIFNLLEALDVEEAGRVATGISQVVKSLHEGSLVLGLNEPRFREVAERLVERFLSSADWQSGYEAVAALSENLEVLIRVMADSAVSRPELMAAGASCAARSLGSLIRGLSYSARRLEVLPDAFFETWGRAVLDHAELRELGELVNSLLVAHNRLADANPGMLGEALDRAWSGIDPEELGRAAREGMRQTFGWLLRQDPAGLFEPGEAGRLLNELIAAYNRSPAFSPGALRDYLGSVLGQLDPQELGRALDSAASQVVEAVTAEPALARVLMRSALGALWKAFKGTAGALLAAWRGRKAGG